MKINICGIPHTIIEKEDAFDSNVLGEIDHAKATITLNKDMPDELKDETLCHEIVHGMLVHLGRLDLSNDETLVQSLGNAIYQTFEVKRGAVSD